MGKQLTVQQQKALTIRDYLHEDYVVAQLQMALPKFLDPERFLRLFYTAILRNPKLLDCSKESMLSVLIESASLGLEPILGKAAIVPYNNVAQFQPMYRGLIDLARRTADVKIVAHVVYEKDEFDIVYGINETLRHKPCLSEDRGNIVGAYTIWYQKSGDTSFTFMPAKDIYKIRDRSTAYQYATKNPKNKDAQKTPWITDPGEMCKKTVIKRHSKLEPCSVEMQRAIEVDNYNEIGEVSPISPLASLEDLRQEPEVVSFEDTIPKNTDMELLKQFLAICAENNEATIEEVKAEAAKSDDFWSQFKKWAGKKSNSKPESALTEYYEKMKEFKNRLGDEKYYELLSGYGMKSAADAKTKKVRDSILQTLDTATTAIEGKEMPDETINMEMAPGECPNNGDIMTMDYCDNTCLSRKGCPVWET